MSKADQWKDCGSAVIVLKQVASPTVQEVDSHTESRYLYSSVQKGALGGKSTKVSVDVCYLLL